MKIKTNVLTGKTSDLLTTEIMYHIASAKSLGQDLVKFNVTCQENESEKRFATVSRILKSAKRNGLIQLFVLSTDFDKSSTEVEYLTNKYPRIFKDNNTDEIYYIIKL